MSHALHNTVYSRLAAIMEAEKITRKELAALSREALTYVCDTDDIDLVNRLINVLTPVNQRVAILYFSNFLPWQVEKMPDGSFSRFGKRLQKEKQVQRRMDAIAEWLSDDSANIWAWAEANIEVEQKKVDLGADLRKALAAAVNGVETDKKIGKPLTPSEIMAIVVDEVSAEDVLGILEEMKPEPGMDEAA